jgi:hypothetical protein
MATPRPRKDTALVPKTMRYRASYFSDHRFLFASAATKIPPPRGTTVVSDRGPPAMPDNIGDIHPSPPPLPPAPLLAPVVGPSSAKVWDFLCFSQECALQRYRVRDGCRNRKGIMSCREYGAFSEFLFLYFPREKRKRERISRKRASARGRRN